MEAILLYSAKNQGEAGKRTERGEGGVKMEIGGETAGEIVERGLKAGQ
jgi:hypothetical protein